MFLQHRLQQCSAIQRQIQGDQTQPKPAGTITEAHFLWCQGLHGTPRCQTPDCSFTPWRQDPNPQGQEMAQWVPCLLYTHENQPQHPHKTQAAGSTCNPRMEGQQWQADSSRQHPKWQALGSVRTPPPKIKNQWKVVEEDTRRPPPPSTNVRRGAHTCLYAHTLSTHTHT